MKNVSILADSLNVETGDRATTFLLHRFPYALIQEPATHRILSSNSTGEPELLAGKINPFTQDVSRNSASLRAIPIQKTIDAIRQDPYIPTWTSYQKGMGGGEVTEDQRILANYAHSQHLDFAVNTARHMAEIGIAKQDANRYLAPFMRIPIIVTATEWDNFFRLRTAKNVQPDFRAVALEMQSLRVESIPINLVPGQWHIPFGEIKLSDRENFGSFLRSVVSPLESSLVFSAARCAWISYASHDGDRSFEKAQSTHDGLIKDCHGSPMEHQLKAVDKNATIEQTRNFRGFIPYRHFIENNLEVG